MKRCLVVVKVWAAAAALIASLHASELPPAPEKVTSFGAVTAGDCIYVFGGHRGERHDYTAEMVSGSFHRLNLREPGAWEVLQGSAPGQGLALVEHGGVIYRIGGMAARNEAGAKQDLFSTNLVERFDPRDRKWTAMEGLPAGRSSHDAVTIGNTLYVAGGWRLAGGTNKPVWHSTALALDLADPKAKWREFDQPFKRRALAMAAVRERIFCIGGMDSDNKTTLAVAIFDAETGQWSEGPDLPPGRHKGFSCAAIAQNGAIYASAFKGDLLRLARDEKSWEVVGQLDPVRISHRMVVAGSGRLAVLGGEDDGGMKRPEIQLFNVSTESAAF